MLKFLVVLLVVGIGVWSLVSRLRGPRQDRPAKGAEATRTAEAAETAATPPLVMAECAHCGLHLPAGDAVTDGARPYCSDAHRRLGPARVPPE